MSVTCLHIRSALAQQGVDSMLRAWPNHQGPIALLNIKSAVASCHMMSRLSSEASLH